MEEYITVLFPDKFRIGCQPDTVNGSGFGGRRKKMTIDLSILDNEPEALAKITEALAKVYFDNVLKKGYDIISISAAYSTAFKLCPNYRLILKSKPGFEKYQHLSSEMGEITSLPIQHFESLNEK